MSQPSNVLTLVPSTDIQNAIDSAKPALSAHLSRLNQISADIKAVEKALKDHGACHSFYVETQAYRHPTSATYIASGLAWARQGENGSFRLMRCSLRYQEGKEKVYQTIGDFCFELNDWESMKPLIECCADTRAAQHPHLGAFLKRYVEEHSK